MKFEHSLNSRAIAAGCAAAMLAGGLLLCMVTPAHAATATLKGTAANGGSYSKAVAMGKTVGKATSTAKAITGITITKTGVAGDVVYKLNGKSAKNGKKIAAAKGATTLTVSLSGTAAKKYDVYYRTYTPGYGWLGWAKNGAKAGTTVSGKTISAYQVKLVAKGKALSGYSTTKSVACISNAGFYNGLTGDAATDAKIAELCKGQDLEGAFKAFIGKMGYASTGRDGLSYGLIPEARMVTEAKTVFSKSKGDCYTYSSGFCYIARFLGYEATAVSGTCQSATGAWNANSWTEVIENGVAQIWNANLQDQADGMFTGAMSIYVVVKNDDGTYTKTADKMNATPKLYGITYAEVNNIEKTMSTGVFTGYGYAKTKAEEI